ncbi:MAG: hypothetical protein LBJ72_01575 [Dysgonamonadaceae bacterium]|jgi:VIT1/CCC1 family predicted Fe2+/Mn2+ transporter|nr:hypothetical protein [Dysgonamonadaceae bacterium]
MEYLSYPLAAIAIILGYLIYRKRKNGAAWADVRILVVSLVCMAILLWALNIYVGYFSQ